MTTDVGWDWYQSIRIHNCLVGKFPLVPLNGHHHESNITRFQRLQYIWSLEKKTVLWNRNDILRFRFLLLKSYGSGSDFWKSYVSGSGSYFWKVTVPVPVPVLAPYLDHKKLIFQEKFWNFFAFLPSKLFYKEKVFMYFDKFIVKCEWKNLLMKVIKYIMLYLVPVPEPYGSDFLTSYGSYSGSSSQKVTVPTVPVPVPQLWKKNRIYIVSLSHV